METEDTESLKNMEKVKSTLNQLIKSFGLTEVGTFYYEFPGGGFTGVVSLIESHIAVHTWPELGALTLDVYLCNYTKDNSQICKDLFDKIAAEFTPSKISKRIIRR